MCSPHFCMISILCPYHVHIISTLWLVRELTRPSGEISRHFRKFLEVPQNIVFFNDYLRFIASSGIFFCLWSCCKESCIRRWSRARSLNGTFIGNSENPGLIVLRMYSVLNCHSASKKAVSNPMVFFFSDAFKPKDVRIDELRKRMHHDRVERIACSLSQTFRAS